MHRVLVPWRAQLCDLVQDRAFGLFRNIGFGPVWRQAARVVDHARAFAAKVFDVVHFVFFHCFCGWVLVVQEIGSCDVESGDVRLRVTRVLCHLFGRCQINFVQGVLAADLLCVQGHKHLALYGPAACLATLGLEDHVGLAAPVFKSVEHAAVCQRVERDPRNERGRCWGVWVGVHCCRLVGSLARLRSSRSLGPQAPPQIAIAARMRTSRMIACAVVFMAWLCG